MIANFDTSVLSIPTLIVVCFHFLLLMSISGFHLLMRRMLFWHRRNGCLDGPVVHEVSRRDSCSAVRCCSVCKQVFIYFLAWIFALHIGGMRKFHHHAHNIFCQAVASGLFRCDPLMKMSPLFGMSHHYLAFKWWAIFTVDISRNTMGYKHPLQFG